jgi:hypothetical protein
MLFVKISCQWTRNLRIEKQIIETNQMLEQQLIYRKTSSILSEKSLG